MKKTEKIGSGPLSPTTTPSTPEPADSSLVVPEIAAPEKPHRPWWRRLYLHKVALFIFTLYLFILAITLMKDGARGVWPLVQRILSLNNPANSLGFGWLFAYLIMSGSPVAASALTFFDTGTLDELSAFAMIAGSRLGASFIVLFIGFLYVLRGRNRAASLNMGLLSLTVTASTYIPSFFLGALFLRTGWIDGWQLQSGALLNSIMDTIIQPVVDLFEGLFPEWGVFLVGLGVVLLSFNLFDKCLPQMAIKESQLGRVSRLVYHPLVMFLLGALVTTISMSVSLSLSILVPLSNRGFIRRENVIPYIMGANITTFIDTLLASVLLGNPDAFTIVLVGMLSNTVISIAIMMSIYRPYRRLSLKYVDRITENNRNLAFFMISIFIIPILLMILG